MAKVEFKQYLHSESLYEMFDYTFEHTDLPNLPEDKKDELMQKIGRPFYEITLDCVLDTETGDVQIVKCENKRLIDLASLAEKLRTARLDQRMRGHDWDVEDVMAVLRDE